MMMWWCARILLLVLACTVSVALAANTIVSAALVIWYVPDHGDLNSTIPYWHDPGFRSAIKLLDSDHSVRVTWFNLAEEGAQERLFEQLDWGTFDFVLGKGCWHTPADKVLRGQVLRQRDAGRWAPRGTLRVGLFPACSSVPPADEETGRPISLAYDAVR